MQGVLDLGKKARLYIDMTRYDGFELGVATEKLKHFGRLWNAFDKYAVVGDQRWMEIWIKIDDPITSQQIRHFHPEKNDEAWVWLLEE